MTEMKCPKGMVLIQPKGAVYPDEPAFCIGKTEVAQEEDGRYWAAQPSKGFKLYIKLVNGRTKIISNEKEKYLRALAARRIRDKDVSNVEIKPIEKVAKPKGDLAGPRKPAVWRTWFQAREYCQVNYRGGDLPTERQWKNACGQGKYCTASGKLSEKEAVYHTSGPADVGSTLPNQRGVMDMTGNVWEWIRDDDKVGKRIFGGSWYGALLPSVRLMFPGGVMPPTSKFGYVGFRCVAKPKVSKSK